MSDTTKHYFLDTEFIEDGTTIDLISIGIVCSDGREYYAEVLGVDWSKAHPWVVENVKPHLTGHEKTRDVIRRDIERFVDDPRPEFWAYCGAYDWVAINQLFGPMVQHPRKWPYFCNDIASLATYIGFNHRLTDLPTQTGAEHNALNDARWTHQAWVFLMTSFGGINMKDPIDKTDPSNG